MKTFNRRGGFHNKVLPYRSGLEDSIADQLKHSRVKAVYEGYSIDYEIPASSHTYTPDFVLPNGIIIETKGIFDATDRKKHLLIKEQHPNLDIRFVFSNINAKIYKGSKTTHAEWCRKHGFLYAHKAIPASWFKEAPKDTSGLRQKKVKDAVDGV